MRTVKDAIEWSMREEPPEVYISIHPKRTKKAMLILVGEVQKLQNTLTNIKGKMPSIDDTPDTQSRMWEIDRLAKDALAESV